MGIGTAINVVAVVVGAGIGTLVGARLSEGMRETAMHAIGLVTLLVGIQSFLRFDNPLVPLVSVILGLVAGELLDVDGRLKRFGDALEQHFSKGGSPVSRAERKLLKFRPSNLIWIMPAQGVTESLLTRAVSLERHVL